MEQKEQGNREQTNKSLNENYRTFEFVVRKDNVQLINKLREVDDITKYITTLIEEDIKRNKKYNYLDDTIMIDFDLPQNIKHLVDEAEKADLEDDYGLYICLASAIDTNAKNATRKRELNEYQWEVLVRRFRP